MTFALNPAVRKPTGQCIEEENCDWERATVCAFDEAKDMKTKVAFLACMDDSHTTKALAAAKTCASAGSLDDSALETCFNGSQGDTLLEAASKVWNKAFPSRATVPHIFVAGKNTDASYSTMKKAICNAGSSAKVCSSATVGYEECAI